MTVYYTLTQKGHQWLDDEVIDPPKYKKILASLAELISDNDVPRTPSQVSRVAEVTEQQATEGLISLAKIGYVALAKAPQPSEKLQTPKLRIRPMEELMAAEVRQQESQKRYLHSDKGKVVHYTYEHSEKGQTKNGRYWSSDRGKLVHKAYRLRRRLKELTAFLTLHKNQKDELGPLIQEVKVKLAEVDQQLSKFKQED
jgi:type II secretory pathway component GspD/PulD (secretin)